MFSKEEAYKKIASLVQRFEEQKGSYKSSNYNETQTRRDFIDPFFKALGWDVDNEYSYSEMNREVIHEDRVKIGKATKAPDYSFRLGGGNRLFFVEAKKPSVLIKDDMTPAYQVRRYGWSANLAISIVTDFEEFAIYDCTKKPAPTDKASIGRVKYITYNNYLSEFDFLWETFSKENVLKGGFEKFIKSDKQKKGTTTVDDEFLQSLDTWRTYLANNIALRNTITEEELNFVVQHIIDRIIFLRIAEDRGVEADGNLQSCVISTSKTSGGGVVDDYYQNLMRVFHTADQKYNSGLFDFNKDKISSNIAIDNKVIKSIITALYFPSPFAFDVIPVEILGSAYEQFLGKQITLSKSGRAVIEEKPEVRKAGGVYYTPQYIVEYIVAQTVGKLIANKTPKEVSKIKIVDPACGSGSFLIGAYQHLLNWHLDYYLKNSSQLQQRGLRGDVLTPTGSLTTAEKKRILLNNIYGVDLDANAVEVSKLSLLLKCMEGETEASIATQTKLFNDRILPTLDGNIKCGNSLIGDDFYEWEFEYGDDRKIKPFNWQKAFPEVFKRNSEPIKESLKDIARKAKEHAKKPMEFAGELEEKLNLVEEIGAVYEAKPMGGFDVVIGNPPYVTIGGKEDTLFLKKEVNYFLKTYLSNQYKPNLYAFFYEKAFKILKAGGIVSFIVPRTFLDNVYYKKLRQYFVVNSKIRALVKLNFEVFKAATTGGTSICFFEKSEAKNAQVDCIIINNKEGFNVPQTLQILQQDILIGDNKSFSFVNSKTLLLIDKLIAANPKLETYCSVNNGANTGNAANILLSNNPSNKWYRKILEGKDINRYQTSWRGLWIQYDPTLKKRIDLKDLKTKQNKIDFALRDERIFNDPKIIIRQTADRLIATIDTNKFVTRHSTHCILNDYKKIDLKFLLGLINSKLLGFYYNHLIPEKGKAFAEVKAINLKQLPIKTIDATNVSETKAHNEIVKYVDQLLKLHEEIKQASLQMNIDQILAHIDFCEDKINETVYRLYNLTPQEIDIIEEN